MKPRFRSTPTRYAVLAVLLAGLLLHGLTTPTDAARPTRSRPKDKATTQSPCPVIALDIGHSPRRPGAISARGVNEYEFNRQIAQRLQRRLLALGTMRAFCIDAADKDLAPAARAALARRKGANLLLSIHHDSVQPRYLETWEWEGRNRFYSDRFSGYSLFYSEKNPRARASLQLGMALGDRLREAGLSPSLHHAEPIPGENRELVDSERGVYRFDELLILKNASMPAVLLECGIILNRADELRALDPAHQTVLVEALARALGDWARATASSSRANSAPQKK